MGEVFAAENIRTGRPVAVKLLRADSKSKTSAVERFRREARAAGSINSDHVTQVLDVEDDPEHGIVIVFELLEGESLIDRLKRTGPIPFDELHPIIEEVWVGLSDAHKAGIIHRDLKPSNVFLERRPDGQQRVKLLDFGISKLPKEMGGETLTEMGQSLGTFSFMPPEQIGRAKTVDHRADIYATTTMIYQSLTGQLPYNARNILVMVELKSKTNPRPLAEALGSPVDPALEAFIAKGLARNPSDRFQNALEALESWRDLKQVSVPASRRAAISSMDLNAQARLAATPASPLPAAGRPPTVPPGARIPTPFPGVTGAVPSAVSPPAPVVPAGMLEPVMQVPASLPRLYDQTESTTDISRIEMIQPLLDASSGVKAAAEEATQPEARAAGDAPMERRGPAGTRVMPPSIVQEAVALAEARKASQAGQADPRATGQSPQASPYRPQAPGVQGQGSGAYPQAHSGGYAPAATPSHGMPAQPRAPSGTPSHGLPAQPRAQAASQSAPGVGGHAPAPASGVHPVGPSGWGSSPPQAASQAGGPGAPMMRMPSAPPGAISSAPPSPPVQSGMRMASQPPSSHAPIPLQTLRLPPDEQSSIPASQDQTMVYRPKNKAPEKKSGIGLYVLGALAFAVVGFGIVYVVQLLVRSLP